MWPRNPCLQVDRLSVMVDVVPQKSNACDEADFSATLVNGVETYRHARPPPCVLYVTIPAKLVALKKVTEPSLRNRTCKDCIRLSCFHGAKRCLRWDRQGAR